MPQDYQVQQQWVSFAIESTWDTAVTPDFWLPIKTPTWTPDLKWLPDTSSVGSPTMTRDLVPGVESDKLDFKHNMYLDSIGAFLRGIFGGADTVTGSGPYAHHIKLLNNASTASQPPSLTLVYFDGAVLRQMTGARMPSMNITWSADGTVDVTSDFIGMPMASSEYTTNTPSTASMVPGYGVTFVLGGVPLATLVSGSIDITRVDTSALFTATNTGVPHNVFSGPIQIKGKAKALIESGDFPWFTNALNRDQLVQAITFTEPESSDTLALTLSATQFMEPKNDNSKKWLMVDVNFEGVGNTTDAASGISPGAVILTNGQSAAY